MGRKDPFADFDSSLDPSSSPLPHAQTNASSPPTPSTPTPNHSHQHGRQRGAHVGVGPDWLLARRLPLPPGGHAAAGARHHLDPRVRLSVSERVCQSGKPPPPFDPQTHPPQFNPSAFAYLMALLLASLVWTAIPPAQGVGIVTVAVGVLCQALLRAVLFRLYQRTEVLIKSANHPILHMPLNDVTSSLGASLFKRPNELNPTPSPTLSQTPRHPNHTTTTSRRRRLRAHARHHGLRERPRLRDARPGGALCPVLPRNAHGAGAGLLGPGLHAARRGPHDAHLSPPPPARRAPALGAPGAAPGGVGLGALLGVVFEVCVVWCREGTIDSVGWIVAAGWLVASSRFHAHTLRRSSTSCATAAASPCRSSSS